MDLSVGLACNVCGACEKLLRCTKCKLIYYCTKEHQVQDWKQHKRVCNRDIQKPQSAPTVNADNICKNATSDKSDQVFNDLKTITSQGSSEDEILQSDVVSLNSTFDFKSSEVTQEESSVNHIGIKLDDSDFNMPISGESVVPSSKRLLKHFPEVTLDDYYGDSKPVPFFHNSHNLCTEAQDTVEEICRNVIRDMNNYGLCVLDNFLGPERGYSVLQEVLKMYSAGVFKDGQLVTNTERRDLRTIRGDKILWVDGKEPYCTNIGQLVNQIDNIVTRANKMNDNGKLGQYNIKGRTKAMVACYPGSGSHYVKHVDNPNKDGRCITAIYYLNKDWDVDTCGGLLRVFPEGWKDTVANIEPLFDRVLFFWSDRRNPHEVQPAYQTRYAITLWYFDAVEREEATRRFQREHANRSTQKQ